MGPDPDLVSETPSNTIAIALSQPGQAYVVYVADQREVDDPTLGQPCQGRLAFALPAGGYTARLYSPADGAYQEQTLDLAGGDATIDLEPFTHDIVVQIEANG
jgi:hypothetical protein